MMRVTMRMGKMALDSRETSGLVAVPVRLEVSGGDPSGDEKVFIF